jgi:hypothetical protein
MAFHSDFWVVTGTAAPIIALSVIISVGEAIRQGSRIEPTGHLKYNDIPYRDIRRFVTASTWVNVTNIGLQIFILFYSLESLAAQYNYANQTLVICMTLLGLILLIATTMLSALIGLFVREANRLNRNDKAGTGAVQGEDEI